MVQSFNTQALVYGSKFQYSSFGIALLGHILSLKAGIPYDQLVRDRILNVLGMC
ncbi:hypothetical protein DYY65_06355 [Nitrososphaera sp. AFS]|nr:hypothetical protein [Nitrososphaera sp. AFS]